MKQSDLPKLAAHFPKEDVRWRAQTVTKDGKKALALAYLDARDVMDRLDEICGPAGWQTRHRDAGNGKLACGIGIYIEEAGEWIWKSDGAGATDVEADKGAFSDALKRAAVAWGVGRYLYDIKNTWVPCKSYEANGRHRFSEFTQNPWEYVKNTGKDEWTGPLKKTELQQEMRALAERMQSESLVTLSQFDEILTEYGPVISQAQRDLPTWYRGYLKTHNDLMSKLQHGTAAE